MEEPELGLLISPSGVRKVAALSPYPDRARTLLNQVASEVRRTLKVVGGTAAPPSAHR